MITDEQIKKIDEALGNSERIAPTASLLTQRATLRAIIELTKEVKQFNTESVERSKKEQEVFDQYLEKLRAFEVRQITIPETVTVKNPVTEVRIANMPQELTVKEPGWFQRFVANRKQDDGILGKIAATIIAVGKLIPQLTKYEGEKDKQSLRVIMTDGKGKEIDMLTLLAGLARYGGASSGGSAGIYQVTGYLYDSSNNALQVEYGFGNVNASQTDSSIVAAVSGKKIRVLAAYAVAGATATSITFNSKGAGAGTAISAAFANAANGGEILPPSALGWFETSTGQGLTVTTGAGSATGVGVVYVKV